ncbi:MAG: lasso peptide biosynthesis B2 protein [Pseudomonadota bacterium]
MVDHARTPPAVRELRRTLYWHARFLPAYVAKRNLQSILRYLDVEHEQRFDGIEPARIRAWVLRATRKPWLMRNRRCLRQGLLGTRFMLKAGHKPDLVFGVDPASLKAPSIEAHCWVELGGEPVLNDAQGTLEVYRWTSI